MLEVLFKKYQYINKKILDIKYKRYFFEKISFNDNLIGIIGPRGIGKTTFLLQYLNELNLANFEKLYFSVDSIISSGISLFDIAEEFSLRGGKVLVIDEIHKYINFEIELKEIYDFLDIKVIFSGSSAIVLKHKKADLSRRAVLHRVKGLSYREFLELSLNKKFPKFSMDDILSNHIDIAASLAKEFKPLQYFKEYLQSGYYPFYFENKDTFYLKLEEVINNVVESDLPFIFNIEPKNITKLKQLILLICNSTPYELNLSSLSKKIGVDRKTLYLYIHYLSLGDIFNKINQVAKRDGIFNKPAKLLLNNPNLHYAYCNNINNGSIRESFFINQLDKEYDIKYSKIGDFLVEDKYIFEVGGKNKSFNQIKDIENSFVVADDVEIGFGNKIPLWLFGFLY
jgi:predicted AAA+ superfamily ATPase